MPHNKRIWKWIWIIIAVTLLVPLFVSCSRTKGSSSSTVSPGIPNQDNISELFIEKNIQYYTTFGGTLYSAKNNEIIDNLQTGRGKWSDTLMAYYYIDSGYLYRWSFSQEREMCVEVNTVSEPLLYAVTSSCVIIKDIDINSNCLYRVSAATYEITKLLDRDPGEIITKCEDFIYILSSDYSTIYELNCNNGVLDELMEEQSDDPISYAIIKDGSIYYIRAGSNEINHCETSLSSASASDIHLPNGMPGSRTIGLEFLNEYMIIARCDEAKIYICSVANSFNTDEDAFALLHEANLNYTIPGTFMLSVALNSICYALKTHDKPALIEIS